MSRDVFDFDPRQEPEPETGRAAGRPAARASGDTRPVESSAVDPNVPTLAGRWFEIRFRVALAPVLIVGKKSARW